MLRGLNAGHFVAAGPRAPHVLLEPVKVARLVAGRRGRLRQVMRRVVGLLVVCGCCCGRRCRRGRRILLLVIDWTWLLLLLLVLVVRCHVKLVLLLLELGRHAAPILLLL